MKHNMIKGVNGKPITLLYPETVKDEEEIYSMEKRGEANPIGAPMSANKSKIVLKKGIMKKGGKK